MLYDDNSEELPEFIKKWQCFAFELENYLISTRNEKWNSCPLDIVEAMYSDTESGCSAEISYHPIFGYFHIFSCGQGPGIGSYEQFNEEKLLERINLLTEEEKKEFLDV